ncbi:MAG TPA: hypothetical protein VID04_08995 [Methylomirabilota bacterium]
MNAADDLANSDFILPGLVRRGPLTVAVGSGGASPALVRAIREDLERYLGPECAELAELVADVCRELRTRGRSPDGATWSQALDAQLRSLVKAGRRNQARVRLLERLGAA